MTWRRHLRLAITLVLLVSAAGAISGQSADKSRLTPTDDPEFARAVREWTTKPEFLSPLVDHLPKVAGVPSPKDVIGHHVGEPKKLTYTADLYRYYRALEAHSPRVKILPIGTTDEGREFLDVMIGSEESIRNLETYRRYLAQLADPRQVPSDAAAREIVAKAKPIYHFMGGLHSGETGPSEMLMELAYRLAADESPLFRQIRDQVIVSITPAADPDGRDRSVDWYYHHTINDTTEDSAFGGPPYWGKYIFHDNNRDINASQVTTRALVDWYLKWHPIVMHDLHESVPFLYIYGAEPPHNTGIDPITYSEIPWFANFELSQFGKYGMPGVWWWGYVDAWSPGYVAFTASNHNAIQRMYETFGNGGANTLLRHVERRGTVETMSASYTSREWYRTNPPYPEVTWSIRNNTNYMETGVISALQLASTFPKLLLENFYKKSVNSLDEGRTRAPYAYVIPGGQRDATRVARMLDLLAIQGIEIRRSAPGFTLGDATFPAGSYLVKLDQPYGRFAKVLLQKQVYPDANLRTYDDAAWTLGLMSHVEVREIADRAVLDVPADLVTDLRVRGAVEGPGAAGLIVADTGSTNLVTLRYRLKDLPVRVAEQAFTMGGREYPAGSFIVPGVDPRVRQQVEALGLQATAVEALPNVETHDLNLPRLAIYSTWGSTQDVGWVRFAFDKFEVPFDLIYKDDVRRGGLRSKYDVILVPHQGRSGKGIVYDLDPKPQPVDYRKSSEFKTLGAYGEADDITGGMGLPGVAELQRFVDDGGVLITLGMASFVPADFGLTRRVDAQRTSAQFYAPGAIVNADILAARNPIFYGYDKTRIPVRWAGGPLLRVPDEDKRHVLMQYPGGDGNVLSGVMKGAGELRDRPAIVDVPTGKGRVVLFAGNPCYRWQNFGEFNLLFNAILNFDDLG